MSLFSILLNTNFKDNSDVPGLTPTLCCSSHYPNRAFYVSMCDEKVFLTFTFTEDGTVLTTILPILFLYLNTVIVTAGDFEP